ncbi:MAG: tRNA adenosine(34) deaminase TadA [Oscillospiraceae bacterium]|nr:tRNA adenosine(34) deaminase TadA [Clostridia bacterium]MBQ9149256.1 tRNA adenosine(34) deaminase TadA [Oscillospiraceae bacterium]
MNEWMSLALQQAQLAAAAGEIPVGAVLVQGDTLICAAHNQREATHDPTAHAELICLREGARLLGDWRLRDCTLYVTLEPCPMCAGALVMSQLGQCIFGAADERQGCCGSVYDLPGDPHLHGVTRWQGGVMEAECRALLQDFFRSRRA